MHFGVNSGYPRACATFRRVTRLALFAIIGFSAGFLGLEGIG